MIVALTGTSPGFDLTTEYTTTTPSVPATGTRLFSRKRVNFTKLAQLGIAGFDVELQDFLGTGEASWVYPTPGAAATTPVGIAIIATTTTGGTSLIARTPTTTSQFTCSRRVGVSSNGNTNAFGQMRTATAALFRGNAAAVGGFYISIRFGVEATLANSRIIAGVLATWAGNNDPSNATDAFFFGKDSADTNLQVMYNDSSGTCTKIDLGSNFLANTSASDMYEGRLYCPPNGGTMYYWIKNLISGNEASGSVNSNLPTTTTAMNMGVWFAAGSTAGTHAGALCSMYSVTGMP